MKKSCSANFVLVVLLTSFAIGQTQKSESTSTAGKQKQSARLADKVLKFLGISDSPGTLKGPSEVRSGQLWVAELGPRSTRAITESAGYRSPIFIATSKDILALKESEIWRFPAGGSPAKKLYSISGITKLVASSADDRDVVLVLQSDGSGGHPRVGLLSLSTGKITPEPYDRTSSQDLQMVENLESWDRVYGDKRVYVKRETKQAISGTVEWTDVFQKVNSQEPVDVSQCDGANCGQPSMSADGRLIVFVKAEME
jgi:hypothetical protein